MNFLRQNYGWWGKIPNRVCAASAGSGVVVTGAAPGMQLHLRAATIFVAPHFTGSGTRTRWKRWPLDTDRHDFYRNRRDKGTAGRDCWLQTTRPT